ncbi:hypothetical protein GT360_18560 [Vibrio astriarenae]|uniref:DUF1311 domain-containing protein n=1 Tax=Vibrio astriarenae TaxID=1481923 RepID=A0A7Z2YFL6_9VIBR|nr:hypothetical protein [Vibrio astriarenae]QIA65536.1 hypothetical protein GT360_18560 [Vibrio astriarenae]
MKTSLYLSLVLTSFSASSTPYLPSPEQMMFELTEEATCIAAANYLELERLEVHQRNFKTLVSEYFVPEETESNILDMTRQQYMHFIKRANKRYDKDILPSMLISAYTHRCEFMNGFEARKEFDSEPPTI